MFDDQEKIKQIETFISAEPQSLSHEAIGLALLIADAEDRDLMLLRVVEFLAKKVDLNKSFGVAQLIESFYERAAALHQIAVQTAAGGRLERALFVFDEAESEAENVSSAWQRAELLHQIAESLTAIGATHKANLVLEKAIAAAQTGESSHDRQESGDAASVLAEIAENLAARGRIERAESIAATIKNSARRERANQKIQTHAAQIKQAA